MKKIMCLLLPRNSALIVLGKKMVVETRRHGSYLPWAVAALAASCHKAAVVRACSTAASGRRLLRSPFPTNGRMLHSISVRPAGLIALQCCKRPQVGCKNTNFFRYDKIILDIIILLRPIFPCNRAFWQAPAG